MTSLTSSLYQSDSGYEQSLSQSLSGSSLHDQSILSTHSAHSSREFSLFPSDQSAKVNGGDVDQDRQQRRNHYYHRYPLDVSPGLKTNLVQLPLNFDLSFVTFPPPPPAQNQPRNVGLQHTLSASNGQDSGCDFRNSLITSPPMAKVPVPATVDDRGFSRVCAGRAHSFSPAPPDLTFDRRASSLEGLQSVVPPPLPPTKKLNPKENPLVRGLIGNSAFDANNGNNLIKAKQWTHRELVTTVLKNVTITVEWLKDRGLMVGARTCPRCGPLVRLELSRAPRTRHWQSYDQLVWLCHNCDNSTYLRQGSFFDRPFNVSLVTYVEMIYWWARCMPVDQIAEQTRTRQSFVTLMVCLLREVCAFEVGECGLIKGGIGAEIQLNQQSGQFTLNKASCEEYMPTLEPVEATWRLKFGYNAFECVLRHIANMYRSLDRL